MPSLIQGFEYDIFISYRHNDNRGGASTGLRQAQPESSGGWVTEFVNALQEELAATIKEPLSIYFDKNPHDGLLETHSVDKSLEGKLKCLIFIPIISQTYCDPKSFAWKHEFCAFNRLAKEDELGTEIRLINGNVTSRILPVKIHDLDAEDARTIQHEIGGVLRAIEFIYKSGGVNRPLNPKDDEVRTPGKILYRDQVNKVANAVKEILQAIRNRDAGQLQSRQSTSIPANPDTSRWPYKMVGIAGVATLLLVTVLYFMFLNKPETEEQRPLSIAVLPFRNTSSVATQADYGIGLANEIRSKLAESKHFLFISSLQSTIAYMNSTESPVKIGSDLEVDYLLNGIYQLSGDRIKIDVELIDTQTGRSIWNLSFNRMFDDIFEIQANIASKVYSQFSLTDNQSNELPTKSLEAYGHYLKAQEIYIGGRRTRTRESLTESTEHLNLAIQLDSSFLEAYVDMAFHKILRAKDIKESHGANEEYTKMVNEIMRLSNLVDERFPDTWKRIRLHAQITYILNEDFDEAIQLFSEVLQYDPEDFGATAYLGAIHKRKLMQKEALKYHFRARQLNPAAANIWNEIAQDYLSMGDYPSCERSIENRVKLGVPFNYKDDMGDFEPAQTGFYLFSTGKSITGNGFELPNAVNRKFFERDYLGIISLYDSAFKASGKPSVEKLYWKSVAYYHLQASDSLKRYVTSALTHTEYTLNWRSPILYAMIGDREKANRVLKEYRKTWERGGQDTWGMANTLRDEVLLLSLLGDYAGATETLLKLNTIYPNFGDYEFIRVSPFFDKIKKEYPPFAGALNNLKLPARIPMEESMKL